MIILGIESTCDETAAAIVKDGHEILSNVISSQVDIHKEFGGVFPEIACRHHINNILPVIDEALKNANMTHSSIDGIAIAHGPGLMGALLIGLHAAKALSLSWKKKFIGVNHIEAHLYAAMMGRLEDLLFPSLGVVLSGGHTMLVQIDSIGHYHRIGSTVDDAIGEAFDKVAAMLGLPYPGGPSIEKLAKEGDPQKYAFKPGMVKNSPFDFSFSGLKTKVLYTIKGQQANRHSPLLIDDDEKKHIAASFQRAALEDIVNKSLSAATQIGAHQIFIGGGVSNNRELRRLFAEKCSTIPQFWPSAGLSLDNAAMIAGLGYQKFLLQQEGDSLSLRAQTRIPF